MITNTAGTADGVMFSDTPDPNTAMVVGSVVSGQGAVASGNPGDTSVAVSIGGLMQGQTTTVRFDVTVNPLPRGVTEVVNQGIVQGANFSAVPTDDPDTPQSGDPTVTPVVRLEIVPALSAFGLVLAIALLAWIARMQFRRRAEAQGARCHDAVGPSGPRRA